jgi:hypothetical protein
MEMTNEVQSVGSLFDFQLFTAIVLFSLRRRKKCGVEEQSY